MNINLEKINKIFFVGIGGIGISAVARILKSQGKEVIGSDASQSEITDELTRDGIKVFIPQKAENVPQDADLAVYTVAAPPDNIERKKIKELKIQEFSYPEFLGQLLSDKYGIGVSGTDGKTTTTAMIGKIFLDAGLDPTIVIGSKTGYLGGNSRAGSGKHFIFESDEYKRAFDHYRPKIAVITNIAPDHLDYYSDLEDIKSAFGEYLTRVPDDGFIIANFDDENTKEVVGGKKAKIISFAIESGAEVMAKNIRLQEGGQNFDLYYQNKKLGEIKLPLPAKYNIYNSLGAIAVALVCGIDFGIIKKSLADFRGAWRRFEKIGEIEERPIIVDYAHTPYAVRKTIEAAKEFYPNKKILSVFQPHQYSRTKNLFNEFVGSFDAADQVIVSDIFYVKGRERPEDFNISSKKLVEAAKKNSARAQYGGDLKSTGELIKKQAADFDLILIMGAGDIYEMAKKLVK
ncbi:MAG: UDP-N-acetylmuramate--L-alanine ligase [Patescibacteria group bacterium]